MRISDWSSDVCSSDLLTECKPGLFTGLLKRGDALRGFVAVGKSGATGFGSVMLCTGGDEIGTRFVQAAFQLLALSIQPFQRERSEEHTSELQSLMRISYAVFCLKKKNIHIIIYISRQTISNKINQSN